MGDKKLKVLIVDDEAAMRKILSVRIEKWGYDVVLAKSVEEAEPMIEEETPDLILSDVVLLGASGLDLLKRVRPQNHEVPVVLMTAHGNVASAVEAMKEGARDFLTKPLDYDNLHALLETEAAELRHRDEVRGLEARLEKDSRRSGLVGESKAIRELKELIELVAASDASAVITGESGTGKEVIARTVHRLSNRSDAPFVAVNTAAMPEGLIESELFGHEKGAFTGATASRAGCFEQASGGTLLLDEIAEMPLPLQPKLLRILEDGRGRRLGGSKEIQYDVRILAATNRSLAESVKEGRLREDLLFRLNVFELKSPPLREHLDDVPLLAQHFIRVFNAQHETRVEGLGKAALELMRAHSWRGNVRELRNVIERAVIVAGSGWIEPEHLPPHFRKVRGGSATIVLPTGISLAEAERAVIFETLEQVGNNKAEAARRLGVDVKTVRNKLKTYESEDSR